MFSPFSGNYIDIDGLEPIDEKLKLAIDIMNKNNAWKRYIPERNTEVNVYDYVKVTEPVGIPNIKSYLHPLIVGVTDPDVERINQFITNDHYNDPQNCDLCDFYNFSYNDNISFKNKVFLEKVNVMQSNIVPTNLLKKLKWKNYLIVPNYAPYFENHFMIISLNHRYNKIVGSQIQILDYTTLYELLNFYHLNSEHYSFLHNYAHIGSQEHLHLHFYKSDLYSFYDQLSNDISKKYFTELKNVRRWNKVDIDANVKKLTDAQMILDLKYLNDARFSPMLNRPVLLDIEMYQSSNENIMFCKHKEDIYGINGFLISARKSWLDSTAENKTQFVSVVHGFLNAIELSLSHTFCQFWTKSEHYLNIYVVTQLRINPEAKSLHRRQIESARNLMSSIFGGPFNVLGYYKNVKNIIDDFNKFYLNTEFFNLDILNNTFKEYMFQVKNPLLTSFKFELEFSELKKNRLFVFPVVEETLKRIKPQDKPFVLVLVGPAGSGKTRILKNKDSIENKFKINISNSLIINVDDIRLYMPLYKNATDKIKQILETFRNRRIGDLTPLVGYTPQELASIGDLTVDDLIKKSKPELNILKSNTIIGVYEALFNTPVRELGNKTLEEYHSKYFNICHQISVIVVSFMIKEAIKRKVNVILETVDRDYDNLFITSTGAERFVSYDKFAILTLMDDTDESKKFIFRNLIERTYYEGRIIPKVKVLDRIKKNDSANKSYIDNLYRFKNYQYYIVNSKLDYSSIITDIRLYGGIYGTNSDPSSFNDTVGNLITNTDEMKKIYTDQLCGDRTLEKCSQTNHENINVLGQQVDITCLSNPKQNTEDFEFDKKKFNDEITNLILNNIINNDNIRTIIIYDFYTTYKSCLSEYINEYNKHPINTTSPLDISDIKVILKGGSSIRIDIINYLDKIDELISSLDKVKNIQPELLKLKYIFKLMINEMEPSKLPQSLIGQIDDYYNTFGKSDIDFSVILNKDKFVDEDNFDIILKQIEIIAIRVIYTIRKKYDENNIYSHDDNNFLNSTKSLFIKSMSEDKFKYNGKTLTAIIYNKNKIEYNFHADELSISKERGHSGYGKDQLIVYTNDMCEGLGDNNLIETLSLYKIISGVDNDKRNKYRISFNKTLKRTVEYMGHDDVVEFDLLRIKLFTKFIFGESYEKVEELDVTGEIIDISFLKYKDIDNHIDPNEIQTFTFKNQMYDFSIDSYTIYKQIKEINKMLFQHILNAWNVKKYNKRLNRYVVLVVLFLMKNYPENMLDLIQLVFNISEKIKNGEIIPLSVILGFDQTIVNIFHPLISHYNMLLQTYKIFNKVKTFYEEGSIDDEIARSLLREYIRRALSVNVVVEINKEYVDKWIDEFNKFRKMVPEKLNFLISSIELLSGMFSVTTENISTINDKIVQKWGGGITYERNFVDINRNGRLQKYDGSMTKYFPIVGDNGFNSINVFFTNFLHRLDLSISKLIVTTVWKFTLEDIRESKVMNAGSFGYGLKIRGTSTRNPRVKKNFIIKIIPFGNNKMRQEKTILDLVKESFIPFKLSKVSKTSRYPYEIFNENYLMFNFSHLLEINDFYQILNDNTTFNYRLIDDYYLRTGYPAISQAEQDYLRNGNIGYVIMNGGIADLSNIYRYAFAIYHNEVVALTELCKVPDQLSNVHKLCYKDNGNIVYITHNDIKPSNMIFGTKDVTYDIYTKLIDHGANLFSTSFFNHMGTFTILYRNYVTFSDPVDYRIGCELTSPLFDLGSVLFSIIESFLSKKLPNFYTDLLMDRIINAKVVLDNYDLLFEIIYENLETINPLASLTLTTIPMLSDREKNILLKKIILTNKLMEVLNLFCAVKNYYIKKIEPIHYDMLNGQLGTEPKYKFLKFVGNDFEYWDLDSKKQVIFEGEDFDLYKNIIVYYNRKLENADLSITDLSTLIQMPRYRNLELYRINCDVIPPAVLTQLRGNYTAFINPTDDMYMVRSV
jgi:hypothetical protein